MTGTRDLRPLQLFAVALDYAALVVLAITPVHAYGWTAGIYGWTAGMAPAPGALPEDPVGDVRLLITGAAVVIAGGLNLYLAALRRGAWRIGNALLALALAGFWTVKFLV